MGGGCCWSSFIFFSGINSRRSTSLDSLATGIRFSLLDADETEESSEFLMGSPARRVDDLLPLLILPSRSLEEGFSLREGDFSERDEVFFLSGELLFGEDISDDGFFRSEVGDFEDKLLLDLGDVSSFLSRFLEASYSLRDFCDGNIELPAVALVAVLVGFLLSVSAAMAFIRGSVRLGILPRRSLMLTGLPD